MSNKVNLVPVRRRWAQWIAALVLAAALLGLPMLHPGPFSGLLFQAVHAGCQGGSCG